MAPPRLLSFAGLLLLPAALAVPLRAEGQGAADPAGEELPAGAVARLGTLRFRHGGHITAIAFAPGGRVAATGGQSMLRLWETATGKELPRLRGFRGDAVAF